MFEIAPPIVGLLGIVLLLVMICARFPVPLALCIVSIGGLAYLIGWGPATSVIAGVPYEFAASWEMSAIPMFLLMGTMAYHSGMTTELYSVARIWMRSFPGGLAIASNFACAGFSAASGSSTATTVAMGRIAVPEMLKAGYEKGLATGVVASAGALGSLIPPSVLLIIYGIFAGQSVSALFLAGILPGILTAFVYAMMIVIRCRLNPDLAPVQTNEATLSEKISALDRIWPLPLLVLGVIGSIYGGVATPTEAGALGVALVLVVALLQRQLTLAKLLASISEALLSTATIFFVAISAVLLTRFLVFSGLPDLLTSLVEYWSLSLLWLIVLTTLIYIVLGTFLEPVGLVLITLPVLLPVFQTHDVNLIWFGIMVVKYVEIGLVTPPVGMNVFALKSVLGDSVRLDDMFRGVAWFIVCELVIVALLVAFPQIALAIPGIEWLPKYF